MAGLAFILCQAAIDFVLGMWDGMADELHEIAMEQAEAPIRMHEMKLGKTI
jgi:hypothetical protein